MSESADKAKGKGMGPLIAVGLGLALGLYALIAWSTAVFPGGWQMGLAALVLLTAPGLVWWSWSRR